MKIDGIPSSVKDAQHLDSLMAPRSIAVIGASPRKGAHGNTVIKNLQQFKYDGDIFPIHPRADEVLGLPVYTDLASIPQTPDCVVVCLSADKVIASLEMAADRGIQAAVVFASGFAESDEEGRNRQQELVELAERSGMMICGPNCLGLANLADSAILYSAGLPQNISVGDVAILSHSGSACIALSSLTRFGMSYLVSIGNGAIIDVDQYLDFLVDDPNTKIAALFVESIRNPENFATAARRMRAAGKSVIVLKVGRSDKGAAATAAHTGSLSGSQAVYEEFFRGCGVISVGDLDEMIESIVLMRAAPVSCEGKGVAVINVSGGENALTCDIGQDVGIKFSDLTPVTIGKLKDTLPSFGHASNPLDATGIAVFDMQMYRTCIETLADDPNVALVAVSQDCPLTLSDDGAKNYGAMADVIAQHSRQSEKPILLYGNFSGGHHPRVASPLQDANVPLLQGARPSLSAIGRFLESCEFEPRPASVEVKLKRNSDWHARLSTGVAMTERESKLFLGECGLPVTQEALASSAEEACEHAARIGYPVVLKIESPDLPHKTEIGGVELNLADEAQVKNAHDRILKTVRTHAPAAEINGVLVQEMVSSGVEVIAGINNEEPIGMAVVFGAGGVLVELLRDTALALGVFDSDTGRKLISRTRVSKLLQGFRGAPAADIDALAKLLSRLSHIADVYKDVVEAIDLNPIRVDPSGVHIVDALVIPKTENNKIGEIS